MMAGRQGIQDSLNHSDVRTIGKLDIHQVYSYCARNIARSGNDVGINKASITDAHRLTHGPSLPLILVIDLVVPTK